MNDITVILTIVAIALYVGAFVIKDKSPNFSFFTMLVAICGIGAITSEGEITEQSLMLLLPLIYITLTSVIKFIQK